MKKKEKAIIQAQWIKAIQDLLLLLDIPFLEESLKVFQGQHSYRDAAAILDPSPFTHNERQELNAAKNEQLRLYIALAKNLQVVIEKEKAVAAANGRATNLANMFQI